jgi:hypothetical protein
MNQSASRSHICLVLYVLSNLVKLAINFLPTRRSIRRSWSTFQRTCLCSSLQINCRGSAKILWPDCSSAHGLTLKELKVPGRRDTSPPKEIYCCHLEIKPVCHLFSPGASGEKKRHSGKCQNDPDHLEILPTPPSPLSTCQLCLV